MTNEDCVCLDGGWLLWESGLLQERTHQGVGMEKPPPTDPHGLSKLKVLFWQRKLALAVEEFDLRKGHLLGAAKNRLQESEGSGLNPGGPPLTEQEAVALLSELRQKVKRCQRELTKWENERATTEPQEARRARDLTEQNRARLNSFCQAVSEIEI